MRQPKFESAQKSKKQVGDKGEDIATDFLINKGYDVIKRNYHCRYGEIDIIASNNEILAFVEVKTRHTTRFGTPQDSITKAKISKISKTALFYLQENNLLDQSCRFDVIAITYPKSSNEPDVQHIENAFELDGDFFY